MMKTAMVLVLAAMMLPGCGGGGGGGGDRERQPLSEIGVFHKGAIQGLSFRTATLSGATDAAGRFRYVAGETVTFSLGGIELGSAPGAQAISLFQLAKAAVPADELELRTELNRMRTRATPLSAAANRSWLLLALDADGDPENGIDVRAHGEALRSASVDFDVLLANFPGQLEGLAPGMNGSIPAGRPIVHLFRSLDLAFAGGIPARRFGDLGNDGIDDSKLVSAFDAAGAMTTLQLDRFVDGTIDSVTQYQRGVLGRLSGQHLDDDLDGDGEADYSLIVGREFDARGNLKLVTERESGDYLPVEPTEIRRSASHDEFGRVLEETHEQRDAHGVVQHRDRYSFSRDGRGNSVLETGEFDDGADGIIDFRSRKEREFDAEDRVVFTNDTQDGDNDGQPDYRQLSTFDYDAHGRVTDFSQSTDFDGDGMTEHVATQRLWYDAAGNLERVLLEVRDDRAGGSSGIHEYHFTHDAERRQLTQLHIMDFGADGVPDERIEVADRYDAKGMKLGRDVSWLNARTGARFRSSRAEIRYNAMGAAVAETLGWDNDGDGTLESDDGVRIEYDPASDALGQIVSDYFAF